MPRFMNLSLGISQPYRFVLQGGWLIRYELTGRFELAFPVIYIDEKDPMTKVTK